MGKWIYRISIIAMIAAIAGGAIYWVMMQTNPETMTGPWTIPDYPTGAGWLLYPNGGETVQGIVTIRWNTSKTGLGPDDTIRIGWTHDVRGWTSVRNLGTWPYLSGVFTHESWEGCYCSRYNIITDSAPNTGEYQWNATEVLKQSNDEWYPFYIRLEGGKYMDASNTYFNITG